MCVLAAAGESAESKRTWSPKACRPMTIGFTHPGMGFGIFERMIGSRNTVPPRMLRIVPFGLLHISFRLNSLTRASSGVMVAHLTPTWYLRMALAASMVTWSLVYADLDYRLRGQ